MRENGKLGKFEGCRLQLPMETVYMLALPGLMRFQQTSTAEK